MKKLLLVAISTAACALSASPVGNPASPMMYKSGMSEQEAGDLSFRAGYLGDFVTHRKVQIKDQKPSKKSAKFKKNFHGVEGVFNFSDQIDILGRVGYANHTLFSPATQLKAKTKYALSYGIGIRAAVHEMDNISFAVHANYARDSSKIKKIAYPGLLPISSGKNKFHDKTWAVGATVSQQMDNVVPYVGVQYTKNRMLVNGFSPYQVNNDVMDMTSNSVKLKNRKNIGVIAGVGMLYNEKASLNLEGRFLQETAFGVSAQFRF